MPKRFYKHKLLLDEGFYYRQSLPILNSRFDVKHISGDFGKNALPDSRVYEFAKAKGRILVTFNVKDFKPLASISKFTGVIGVSANLTLDQIDKKLTSLLLRSTRKSLLGKITQISGESKVE